MTAEDRGSLATRIEAEKDQWKELATGRHINYEDGLCEGLDVAAEIVRNHPAASPWISVDERLPEDDQHVLILLRIPRTSPAWGSGYFCSPDQTWMSDEGEVPLSRVSHWMPIPDLPPTTGA